MMPMPMDIYDAYGWCLWCLWVFLWGIADSRTAYFLIIWVVPDLESDLSAHMRKILIFQFAF